jgi:GGDEF domain-containing protein
MYNHLKNKRDKYPDYRSSITGYSYADLCDIYKEFSDYVIPMLYSKVIDGPQVIDGDVLRKSLTNQIKEMSRTEKTNSYRRDYLYRIITNYSDKNKDILSYHYSKDGKGTETDYILKHVEDNYERGDVEIVYDKLIQEYVSLDKSIRKSVIERKHKEYLLSVFGDIGSGGSGTPEQHKELSDMINNYEKKLYDYYQIVSETSREFNNVLSAEYLKMFTSVTVSQAINTKLYVAIGAVFFLIAGIVLAVIFGRAGDFANYLLYTDKKTGLANREQIDIFIDEMSKDILPDNYACIYLMYSSLFDHTKKYGRKVADNILKDFSGLVNAMGDENSFVGYNGAGRFVIFTPQCNSKRAETIISVFNEQIEEYNNINPDYKMEYKAVYAVTSDEGTYEIRGILRAAMKKIG